MAGASAGKTWKLGVMGLWLYSFLVTSSFTVHGDLGCSWLGSQLVCCLDTCTWPLQVCSSHALVRLPQGMWSGQALRGSRADEWAVFMIKLRQLEVSLSQYSVGLGSRKGLLRFKRKEYIVYHLMDECQGIPYGEHGGRELSLQPFLENLIFQNPRGSEKQSRVLNQVYSNSNCQHF